MPPVRDADNCVACPEPPPACPRLCPPGEACTLTVRTCEICPQALCTPKAAPSGFGAAVLGRRGLSPLAGYRLSMGLVLSLVLAAGLVAGLALCYARRHERRARRSLAAPAAPTSPRGSLDKPLPRPAAAMPLHRGLGTPRALARTNRSSQTSSFYPPLEYIDTVPSLSRPNPIPPRGRSLTRSRYGSGVRVMPRAPVETPRRAPPPPPPPSPPVLLHQPAAVPPPPPPPAMPPAYELDPDFSLDPARGGASSLAASRSGTTTSRSWLGRSPSMPSRGTSSAATRAGSGAGPVSLQASVRPSSGGSAPSKAARRSASDSAAGPDSVPDSAPLRAQAPPTSPHLQAVDPAATQLAISSPQPPPVPPPPPPSSATGESDAASSTTAQSILPTPVL